MVKRQPRGIPVGGEFASTQRGESGAELHAVEEKTVQYSFLERFEEMNEQYEHDFEGFPNSFAKSDLRGKYLPAAGSDPRREDRFFAANHSNGIPQRMFLAVSSTKDLALTDEEVAELAERNGLTNLRPLDKELADGLRLGERGWVAEYDGTEVAIGSKSAGSRNASNYSFRGAVRPPFTKREFTHLDLRALAGAERIRRKTGVDLLPIVTGSELKRRENRILSAAENPDPGHNQQAGENHKRIRAEHVEAVRTAFEELGGAQQEMTNFSAQRKHFKAQQGSSATAWQDKKHPDELHQKMAAETSLNDSFAKVEIDNDVTPEMYADFEKAWDETRDKLPPIPGDRQPTLRVRYLGRHKATGVFFPHANTIAIDVRNSSSFVHEYGHYVDLVTQDNASLGREFRDVVFDYSCQLKLPPEMKNKEDYFSTPTEVYARGFEMYASQRLGVDNRLLNAEKFDRPDFAPFREDPELKDRMFDLFDKAFGKKTA